MKNLRKLSFTAIAATFMWTPFGMQAQNIRPSLEQLEAKREAEDIRARALLRCTEQRGTRCDTDEGLFEWEAEERARARFVPPSGGGLPNTVPASSSSTLDANKQNPGLRGSNPGITSTNPGITTTNPTQPAANPGTTGTLSEGAPNPNPGNTGTISGGATSGGTPSGGASSSGATGGAGSSGTGSSGTGRSAGSATGAQGGGN